MKTNWYLVNGKIRILKVISDSKIIANISWPDKSFINRDKYSGVGRPKKSDYYSGIIKSSGI